MTKVIASLSVALALAAAAHAEPILWDYTVTFAGDRGSPNVAAGSSSTTIYPRDGAPNYQLYSQYFLELTPAPPAGTQAGNQTVDIGSTPGTKSGYEVGDGRTPSTVPADRGPQNGGRIDALLKATLTIRDVASDTSQTVTVFRDLSTAENGFMGQGPALLDPKGVSDFAFTLGGNDYAVTLHEANGYLPDAQLMAAVVERPELWLTADVTVTAGIRTVVDAPEPGTLALAGIGLAGLFGVRLRRPRVA